MLALDSLDKLVSKKKEMSTKPNNFDFLLYLFFDKGLGYNDFIEAPLPYIFSVLKTHNHIKKLEQKSIDKAKKR